MKIYFPWSTVRALGTKPLGSHFPRVIFLWKEHVRLNFSVMEVQCFQLLQKILQLRNSYCTQKLLRFKRTYPSVLSITYKPTKHTKCTLYLIDTDQTTSFQFFFNFFKDGGILNLQNHTKPLSMSGECLMQPNMRGWAQPLHHNLNSQNGSSSTKKVFVACSHTCPNTTHIRHSLVLLFKKV